MNSVELVKAICKERKIPISRLERECNFANGYIRGLKEGKFPSDRLQIIADYLGVSVDYLLTGRNFDQQKEYYVNEEAARMAQRIFETKGLRTLFDAAEDASPKDLELAAQLLRRLKETNPDA